MNAAASLNAPLSQESVLMTVGGTLALVVLLMVALAWVARRSGFARRLTNPDGAMNVVASRSLGGRERLLLVDVGEQRLVLGVTATQVTCLATQARPETPMPEPQPAPAAFGAMLDTLLKKHRQSR
ncbi:flagellar biosynthetic protein FliO [Enterobacter sp. CC120223-11]|uniref:flagellar biosynthetic protein FliO n=1 Tax=Enterobacter sp. CC120223-11 TaxID=1378073 RepID=UPI000BC50A5E|nr:flagellar biosynthetic protein FliO [Enterobacter sp. CC120223-11]SNY67823.1 flagellar protein FliO/FliZ [Enterobacter sp. CC120223-11]